MVGLRRGDRAWRQISIHAPGANTIRYTKSNTKSNKPIGSPWRIFVTASTHDIPLLASRALVDFRESHLWYYKAADLKPKDMREVSGKYATAFIRALKGSRNDSLPLRYLVDVLGRSGHGQSNNWLEISQTFNLKACTYCVFQYNIDANCKVNDECFTYGDRKFTACVYDIWRQRCQELTYLNYASALSLAICISLDVEIPTAILADFCSSHHALIKMSRQLRDKRMRSE